MAFAASSFPVPLSPVISTGASESAARAMSLYTSSMPAVRPSNPDSAASFVCASRAGLIGPCRSARSTVALTAPISNGLLMKSNAPARTASIAVSSVPNPLIRMTGDEGARR